MIFRYMNQIVRLLWPLLDNRIYSLRVRLEDDRGVWSLLNLLLLLSGWLVDQIVSFLLVGLTSTLLVGRQLSEFLVNSHVGRVPDFDCSIFLLSLFELLV